MSRWWSWQATVGKRPLRCCASPVSLWTGSKRDSLAVASMTFARPMGSRLSGSAKVMPPLPTWPSTSGSLSRPQASSSTTSSITDTSCADLTSATPGRGCSCLPNEAGPARQRRKLPLRRRSTGGDLSWVRQSSSNSKWRSERSQPLDDCGHRGDLAHRPMLAGRRSRLPSVDRGNRRGPSSGAVTTWGRSTLQPSACAQQAPFHRTSFGTLRTIVKGAARSASERSECPKVGKRGAVLTKKVRAVPRCRVVHSRQRRVDDLSRQRGRP
jgi:hypothetical protein